MPRRRRKQQLLAVTWLAAAVSCSTPPTNWERYEAMDGDAKATFLAYYPVLDHAQRRQVLMSMESPELLIKSWGIPLRKDILKPRALNLGRLSMTPTLTAPVTEGTYLNFQSFLNYRDGQRFEMGEDVHWQVTPPVATLEGSVLRYGCLHSDVGITANLFNEAETSQRIEFRKPLADLEIRLREESQGVDATDYLRLRVIAHCKDGTTTEVNCQANWSVSPDEGESLGCGNIRVTSKLALKDHQITVTATYGPIKRTQKVLFAVRRPDGGG